MTCAKQKSLYNILKRNELTARILVSSHHFNLDVKPFSDAKTVKDCVSSGQYTPFISPD